MGLTYEKVGIRPLLIDKLSSILIPKDGVLLPRKDPSYQLWLILLSIGSTVRAFARPLARAFARALELFPATVLKE
jgi:hypothetical protein